MKKLNKRGVLDNLGALGVGVATLTITLVVAFLIGAQAKTSIISVEGINATDSGTFTTAYNASETLLAATATIPAWVPLIILVAIGALLLVLIKGFRK